MAPGLGLILAAAPGEKGRNPLPLGPVLSTGVQDGRFRHAFAASGGGTAATGMANMLFHVLLGKEGLQNANKAARLHHGVATGETVIEDREDKDRLVRLISSVKGEKTADNWPVNAIACPAGLPSSGPPVCEVVADVRGEGIATSLNILQQED